MFVDVSRWTESPMMTISGSTRTFVSNLLDRLVANRDSASSGSVRFACACPAAGPSLPGQPVSTAIVAITTAAKPVPQDLILISLRQCDRFPYGHGCTLNTGSRDATLSVN